MNEILHSPKTRKKKRKKKEVLNSCSLLNFRWLESIERRFLWLSVDKTSVVTHFLNRKFFYFVSPLKPLNLNSFSLLRCLLAHDSQSFSTARNLLPIEFVISIDFFFLSLSRYIQLPKSQRISPSTAGCTKSSWSITSKSSALMSFKPYWNAMSTQFILSRPNNASNGNTNITLNTYPPTIAPCFWMSRICSVHLFVRGPNVAPILNAVISSKRGSQIGLVGA